MAKMFLKEALEIIWERYSGLYAYIEQESGIDATTFRNAYEGKVRPELPTVNKIVEHAMKLVEHGGSASRLIRTSNDEDYNIDIPANGSDKKYLQCRNCMKWKETIEFDKRPNTDPLSYCYKCQHEKMRKAILAEERIKDQKIAEIAELKVKIASMSAWSVEEMEDRLRTYRELIDDMAEGMKNVATMANRRLEGME